MWVNEITSQWNCGKQRERVLGWITTRVLEDALTAMSMSISYNPKYSYVDLDKMVVYLSFTKNWEYFRAISKFKNNPNQTAENHPQNLFLINAADIEFDREVDWEEVQVSKSEFDSADLSAIANAMKSHIFKEIKLH